MPETASGAVEAARRSRTRRPPLVPHQHGAWAFLALPVALGATQATWSPLLLLLVAAWFAAYPLSWALTELASARRPERFRRAAVLWGALTGPAALALLVARPWLWMAAVGVAALFLVNIAYARRGAERALANDLVLIVECTAMVPLLVAVAAGDSTEAASAVATSEVAILSLLCALVLTGSTLHVKSLIRERRNPAFAIASRVLAVASVGAAAAAAVAWGSGGAWLVAPFPLLVLRAWWPSLRTWRPARIGLIELAAFVAVAGSAWLAG